MLLDPATVTARSRASIRLAASRPSTPGRLSEKNVALSAVLWSFGLANVEFEDDAETIAHDDALVPALESKHGSIEPFAQLLADLIQRSIEAQA
jgi:hypothetical protein